MARFVPRDPRDRKQRKRVRSTQPNSNEENALEILPETAAAKQARRLQMKQELRAQNAEQGMTSKKSKRFDKYIEGKLKKQDNIDLIKKLEAEKVDVSLLRSSKKLGRSGGNTKREVLTQALNEERSGIDSDRNRRLLYEPRVQDGVDSDHSEEPEYAGSSNGQQSAVEQTQQLPTTHGANNRSIGSGLKRPLAHDEDGNPVIQQRKRHKASHRIRVPTEPIEEEPSESSEPSDSEESAWEGFSASANDEGDETDDNDGFSVDDTDSNSEEEESNEDLQERSSAFKAWALSQRNTAVGFQPSRNTEELTQANPVGAPPSRPKSYPPPAYTANKDASPSTVPVAFDNILKSERKVHHISINRPVDVEAARQDLPVVAKEQEIMETVFNNDVTILSGATGSGKTTQIPQFLFEAGFGDPKGPTPGMIGITQPRRVAAVSMAKRVAYEMGNLPDKVAHQVRFDSSVGARTAMKFMTDGVLLREVVQDFTLSKYSVVIVDEAHERTVNTDILIGMLSRIVETRRRMSNEKKPGFRPLKVIIMSATLRVAEFRDNKELFRGKPPPVVDVEGKQYSVSTHFARRTNRDYVEEMYQKVSRGHRKLPSGGMLVFMTGQSEIEHLERRLKSSFPCTEKATPHRPKMHISAQQSTVEDEDVDVKKRRQIDEHLDDTEDFIDSGNEDDDASVDEFDLAEEVVTVSSRVHVLPLYSQLPAEQQALVFEPPPADSRLIILATNVAETSITIPNIRYVFDTGRAKVKRYDPQTGVQTFAIDWISKASAQQRAGRAGRTGPGGHCYRLYSSAIYDDAFPPFTDPEITKTPIEGVILQLKAMGIPEISRFPFPTPLEPIQVRKAQQLLQHLGCLEAGTNKITDLGKQLSIFPISPRLARIIALAERHSNMLPYALSLVAVLGVQEVFVGEAQLGLTQDVEPSLEANDGQRVWSQADAEASSHQERLRKDFNSFHGRMAQQDKYSDGAKLLTALIEYQTQSASRRAGSDLTSSNLRRFTRLKSLQEATQLRGQLDSLIALRSSSPAIGRIPSAPPSSAEALMLRQILAAGYIDNLAQRADLSTTPPESKRSPSSAVQVPYVTLFSSKQYDLPKVTVEELDNKGKDRLKFVYVHPSSVLAHVSPQKLPQYVVYSHLSTASTPATLPGGGIAIPRTRMHPLSPVPVDTIKELTRGTPLAREGKAIGNIETLQRSDAGEERRAIWSVPFITSGPEVEGGREWPLPPARRIVQVRKARRGWVEEGHR